MLIVLWLLLTGIFLTWGYYSSQFVVQIPTSWEETKASSLYPLLYFATLLSSVTWFVFASIFMFFSYGTFRAKKSVWSAGIIVSTIFIVILGFMLASLMVTVLIFLDYFLVGGFMSVILAFLIDLAIVFCLTRPVTKAYFEEKKD